MNLSSSGVSAVATVGFARAFGLGGFDHWFQKMVELMSSSSVPKAHVSYRELHGEIRLAKTSRVLLLILWALLMSSCAFGLDDDERAQSTAMAQIRKVAGAESRECGFIPLGLDATAAFACAREATASEEKFHVAVQEQGIDSILWVAAIYSPEGNQYLVRFDSSPSGGAWSRSRLTKKRCTAFQFQDENFGKIRCAATE